MAWRSILIQTNDISKSERGRGMAAAAVVPIWNVNNQFATTLQQRYQSHAFPENPSGLLASEVIGPAEFVDALPLTMPHQATRFASSQLWTTDDPDEALRRAASHHYDEICMTGQITLATWDTWHPQMQNYPFFVHNVLSSLTWDCSLPLLIRSLDLAVPGNLIYYPAPCCDISIIPAMPDGSPQRFVWGAPQPIAWASSLPPSIALPTPAPLRYYDAAFNAPVHFNYSTGALAIAPFLAGVNVRGPLANQALHGIYGPPMNPILHNMMHQPVHLPWIRHRMITGPAHLFIFFSHFFSIFFRIFFFTSPFVTTTPVLTTFSHRMHTQRYWDAASRIHSPRRNSRKISPSMHLTCVKIPTISILHYVL